MLKFRARFDGTVLIPTAPVNLPIGQVLEFEVREVSDPPLRSRELLLRVMDNLVPLEAGDREAFERAIDEGKLPVRYDSIFDETD